MTYPLGRAAKGSALSAGDHDANLPRATLAALLADGTTSYPQGSRFFTVAEGYRYQVAASGATDHHLTTAGGVKLYVLPGADGAYNFRAFNPAANGTTDDRPVLEKALRVNGASGVGPTIYFPSGTYFMGATIELDIICKLFSHGNGATGGAAAILRFPADTHGIIVYHVWDETSTDVNDWKRSRGAGSIIAGLQITATGRGNKTHDGIWCKAQTTIRDCIISGFGRDGIAIRASVPAEAPGQPQVWGEASSCVLDVVKCVENGRHGIYVQGADTNGCVIIKPDCNSNGRWGIQDRSFLGNTYIGGHVATNGNAGVGGNAGNQGCRVAYSVDEGPMWRYLAHPNATDQQLRDTAPHPTNNQNIWIFQGSGAGTGAFETVAEWLPGQDVGTYFSGGGYHAGTDLGGNASPARTLFLGCYSENDQVSLYRGSALNLHGLQDFMVGGQLQGLSGGDLRASGLSAGSGGATGRVGGAAGHGAVAFMFSHSSETVDWPWMLRYQSGDWVFKNSTADGVREPARITGQNTTQQFGRGANQPYKFAVPEIIIGARHHTSATAAPTSGSWAQGDIVWNQNATSGGFAGWICVTAGTFGGSAPVFRTFGAISSS